MHRPLFSTLAIATVVVTATVAHAAVLDMPRTTLVAGSSPVEGCDRDGARSTAELAWHNGVIVRRIRVAGLDDRCIGHSLHAVLTGPGLSVELVPGRVKGVRPDDNEVVLDVPGMLRPELVERINIAIN